MSLPMISNVWKRPKPVPPGEMEAGSATPTAVVAGSASVPVELHLEGVEQPCPVGNDIVFLIDNSGSMNDNDPLKKRFAAVLSLVDTFEASRNHLDRIAIYKFQGTSATEEQSWKSWSETRDTVQNLMNQPPPDPGDRTPMADGMKQVNELLGGSDGFYKIVILLSDGLPTEDDFTDTPWETITGQGLPADEVSLIREAYQNRILYSTVYLWTQPSPFRPAVNTLLWLIAKGTDYITPYSTPNDVPKYYFRITDASELAGAFQTLLGEVAPRMVPQDVTIREHINEKLLIDQDAEVVFFGDGFQESENILGFGDEATAEGITTLEGALDLFRENRIFEIRLNELRGEATLAFSVKLDQDSISADEFSNDRICLEVDVGPGHESYISYLQPTGGPGSSPVRDPLPQARICFKKGLSARKICDPQATGDLVKIEFSNLDLHPVGWLEVAEFPSGFVNASETDDDFGFKPFRMLLKNRIIPWFLELVAGVAMELIPDYDSLPSSTIMGIAHGIREAAVDSLTQAYAPLLERETLFDPYLCQFQFAEDPPAASSLDGFWRTINQRGIYKLIQNMPPLSTRSIQFQVRDASYLKPAVEDRWLNWHVDALFPKYGVIHTMSWYRATDMRAENMLTPNPDYSQLVSSNGKPDLFTSTCFWSKDVRKLHALFEGSRSVNDPEGMLNSVDIMPIWRQHGRIVGVSVKVHNCGGQPAESRLQVKSFFMPFTGKELLIDRDVVRYEFKASPPFFGDGECNIQVYPDSPEGFKIYYDRLYDMVTGRQVEVGFLRRIRHAVIINVVDIWPAEEEVMLSNNKAIEIVRFVPGQP